MASDESSSALGEFFSVIKAGMTERMSNPLVMAITIPWLIFNYKVVVIIFSGAALSEKIRYLDDYFTSAVSVSFSNNWIHIYALPALAALIYLFIIPFMNLGMHQFKIFIRNLSYKFEKIRMHSYEDLEFARAEKQEVITNLQKEILSLNDSKKQLIENMNLLSQSAKLYKDKVFNEQDRTLSSDMRKVLLALGKNKNDSSISEPRLPQEIGITDFALEEALTVLVNIGLVSRGHDPRVGEVHCKLSRQGDGLFTYIYDKNNF